MPGWLIALLVAGLTAGPGYLAWRASARVRALETKESAAMAANRVTAEAFDLALRVNNEIVGGLRDEIARLRKELDDLRSQALGAEQRNLEVERKYASMERSLLRMQTLVRLYVKQLRDAGYDVDIEGLATSGEPDVALLERPRRPKPIPER